MTNAYNERGVLRGVEEVHKEDVQAVSLTLRPSRKGEQKIMAAGYRDWNKMCEDSRSVSLKCICNGIENCMW